MFGKYKIKFFIIFVFLSVAWPVISRADYGGQQTGFYVDPSFDLQKRAQITATLIRITPSLYIYVDNVWWNGLTLDAQQKAKTSFQQLGNEYENKIQPVLTTKFGAEWQPGIDRDSHLTVLFHLMPDSSGGYVNTGDEYSRLQSLFSNEREMVYLNASYLNTDLVKVYLAHELTHLIVFNQKERKYGVEEEVWLNEMFAEYSPTLLGYDDNYETSNLKRRVNTFLQFPNDSLTEWKEQQADYGVLNIFVQYLADHYGVDVLADAMQSSKVGVSALDEALKQNGFSETLSQVFVDWTIAVSANDCRLGKKYCYSNKNLTNLRVVPQLNLLPFNSQGTLALTQELKNWSGDWQKMIGGPGTLQIDFNGFPDAQFKTPYLIQYQDGSKEIGWMALNSSQKGDVSLIGFGANIASVIIAPSITDKKTGFTANEKSYPYFWSASTEQLAGSQDGFLDALVLTKKIEFLEKQLVVLKIQLQEVLTGVPNVGNFLARNIKQGDSGEDVKILQTWLAKDKVIYPEGIISGYFGVLTKAAAIRFQEKYKAEILTQFGLTAGTGFVGSATRAKLNQLYGK